MPPLIPAPRHLQPGEGPAFTLEPSTRIVSDEASRAVAELFAQKLRRATGYALALSGHGEDRRGMSFRVDAEADYGQQPWNPEAYRLEVTAEQVRVTGASAHGVFNATQTLRQLLPAAVELDDVLADWEIPALTIVDSPEYEYRGLMIDVARSFLTIEEMERIIDLAALAKISRLHLHLTDDQGWRIEITNEGRAPGDEMDYTQLTAVSGQTAMTEWGYDDEPGRTGFYTQADYRRLVTYAAERHIAVVPEIDLPGHTTAALAAIPELNSAGSSHEGTAESPVCAPDGSGEVGHSYLDPHSEHTYRFARHVLRQIAAITPGDHIHIGGDEPLKMTERHGYDTYLECVGRIVEIVREIGKKPVGWNEIAQTKVGPDTIVQFWQGESTHTVGAAVAGAKILLSRGESSYLDQKYHPEFPIGLKWACQGDCGIAKYYSWEPAELVPDLAHDQIAGVEAPLWSETLRGAGQVLLMAFPRLFAIAELGWSAPATRDLDDFTARVGGLTPRILLGGGNFYDGAKAPWVPALAGRVARAGESIARVAAPGGETPQVRVELEGREVPADVRVVQERGPLHAGPVFDVVVPAEATGSGRVYIGSSSVPVRILPREY